MSRKGPTCPVCSGRMVQSWVDAGHTRHGSCGPEPVAETQPVDAPPPPNGSSPSPTPTPPPDRALAAPLDPPGEDSAPPPTPTPGVPYRTSPHARPRGRDGLTARQREVLRAVKREIEVGGTVQAAATSLGVTESAVKQAMGRMGQNALLAKLTGAELLPAPGPAADRPAVPDRASRGGEWKTNETEKGVLAWQARRAALPALPRRGSVPASAQFLVDFTDGRAASEEELDLLARREHAAAAAERSKILGAREAGRG